MANDFVMQIYKLRLNIHKQIKNNDILQTHWKQDLNAFQ